LARLGDTLRESETLGLPFAVDEAKPNAKHAPKPVNRRVKLDPYAIAAVRLLILTGARLREILDAQWSQVDMERGILFLADSKTGKKPLYLSAAAQSVLAKIPRIKDNPHIIAGVAKGAPRADLHRPWKAVRKAAKLDGVRIHDLRHSFASFGAGASLGLPIIGKLLGHAQAATTHRYAHLDADPPPSSGGNNWEYDCGGDGGRKERKYRLTPEKGPELVRVEQRTAAPQWRMCGIEGRQVWICETKSSAALKKAN
jgi:integrase